MTEVEQWELFGQWTANGANYVMSYITIIFALLLMTFYIGSKLSRTQFWIVCTLFVWSSSLNIYATIGAFWRSLYFRNAILELQPEIQMFMNVPTIIAIGLTMLAGIIVALFFLVQMRHK